MPLGLKLRGTEILFPIAPDLAVVGAYELGNGEHDFNEEQVASSNGTILLHSRRQVYARTNEFSYQIDQSKPPRQATRLLSEERFKPTNDSSRPLPTALLNVFSTVAPRIRDHKISGRPSDAREERSFSAPRAISG
jgi:hypothetical protein